MATRDKDSYIFNQGVTPNTLSVISSKNKIFATNANGDNIQIGVIASFDPSESRTIEPIRGIGFGDHVAELVPGVTEPMTISVVRTALYASNIYQVFGYKSGIDGIVRSLRHHRWPFDVRQEVVFSRLATGGNTSNEFSAEGTQTTENSQDTKTGELNEGNMSALVTVYVACWIADYSVSYASDTALVQETVTLNVSDILNGTDFTQYTNSPVLDSMSSGVGTPSALYGNLQF